MEIISRKEAIGKGLKRYFTGKPCKRGHIAERSLPKSTCIECHKISTKGATTRRRNFLKENDPEGYKELLRRDRENNKRRREEYPEKYKGYAQKSYTKKMSDPEKRDRLLLASREWAKNNKERRAEIRKKWVDKNPDYNREWCTENRERSNAIKLKYREKKIVAQPKWLSETQLLEIDNFYNISKWYEMFSNEKYHVDHIIPLQGEGVCGLHVPWNLQVITASENARKGNTYAQ